MHKIILLIIAVLGVSACSGDWVSYPESVAVSQQQGAVVHAGDILNVSVFEEKDLSGEYQVSQIGEINLPLIGFVSVAGEGPKSVEKRIEKRLKSGGYLVTPRVTVSFVQDHKIYILGEVLESGEFDFRSGMTVLDLVAKARGFSYRANQNEFDIIRRQIDGTEEHITGDVATHLLPNDTIRVRERYF